MNEVITLDLDFQRTSGLIAAYLLPHADGAALIECGPGSTTPALAAGLASHGFAPENITDLLVTHIHLDHAGAAGWLARKGARVHVHHRGLPHLAEPEKLLASAARIYKDRMDALWGETLPVPPERLHPLSDGQIVAAGGLRIRAVDTPGHATHHMAYLLDDLCFSGDAGGIRLAGPLHIVLPMPPPEFHIELWQASWRRLSDLGAARVAPTHFGIYPDAAEHFSLLGRTLEETAAWIERTLPNSQGEALEAAILDWMAARARSHGLTEVQHLKYEQSNGSVFSAWGIERYWRKHRAGAGG